MHSSSHKALIFTDEGWRPWSESEYNELKKKGGFFKRVDTHDTGEMQNIEDTFMKKAAILVNKLKSDAGLIEKTSKGDNWPNRKDMLDDWKTTLELAKLFLDEYKEVAENTDGLEVQEVLKTVQEKVVEFERLINEVEKEGDKMDDVEDEVETKEELDRVKEDLDDVDEDLDDVKEDLDEKLDKKKDSALVDEDSKAALVDEVVNIKVTSEEGRDMVQKINSISSSGKDTKLVEKTDRYIAEAKDHLRKGDDFATIFTQVLKQIRDLCEDTANRYRNLQREANREVLDSKDLAEIKKFLSKAEVDMEKRKNEISKVLKEAGLSDKVDKKVSLELQVDELKKHVQRLTDEIQELKKEKDEDDDGEVVVETEEEREKEKTIDALRNFIDNSSCKLRMPKISNKDSLSKTYSKFLNVNREWVDSKYKGLLTATPSKSFLPLQKEALADMMQRINAQTPTASRKAGFVKTNKANVEIDKDF